SRISAAVADGRPAAPGAMKPVGEQGSSSAAPSSPNSRVGRKRSPIVQGRVTMAAVVIGIDVSRDQLDVHVRPGGESFRVSRDGGGLDELVSQLKPLAPVVVALEATGGFEAVVAASLATAGLPVVVVNPVQVRAFARA